MWKGFERLTQQRASRYPPMPIIVGSPRSGTTLLRFMLDSHPDLAIPPETGFLKFGQRFWGKGDKLRRNFFRSIVDYADPFPTWDDFDIREQDFWSALTQIEQFT